MREAFRKKGSDIEEERRKRMKEGKGRKSEGGIKRINKEGRRG